MNDHKIATYLLQFTRANFWACLFRKCCTACGNVAENSSKFEFFACRTISWAFCAVCCSYAHASWFPIFGNEECDRSYYDEKDALGNGKHGVLGTSIRTKFWFIDNLSDNALLNNKLFADDLNIHRHCMILNAISIFCGTALTHSSSVWSYGMFFIWRYVFHEKCHMLRNNSRYECLLS